MPFQPGERLTAEKLSVIGRRYVGLAALDPGSTSGSTGLLLATAEIPPQPVAVEVNASGVWTGIASANAVYRLQINVDGNLQGSCTIRAQGADDRVTFALPSIVPVVIPASTAAVVTMSIGRVTGGGSILWTSVTDQGRVVATLMPA